MIWGLSPDKDSGIFQAFQTPIVEGKLDLNVRPSLITILFQGNESIVAKTTVTVPSDGGPIEATSTIETVPYWTRSRRKTGLLTARALYQALP